MKRRHVALVALGLLLFPTLFLLWWPTWLTGGSCEYTFHEVSVATDGQVTLRFDQTIPYGSLVEWKSLPDERGNSSSGVMGWIPGRIPWVRWPREIRDTTSFFWITASDEKYGAVPDHQALKERLLLKPGTYRIRNGETLVTCRKVYPDGRVAEGRIRMFPESELR